MKAVDKSRGRRPHSSANLHRLLTWNTTAIITINAAPEANAEASLGVEGGHPSWPQGRLQELGRWAARHFQGATDNYQSPDLTQWKTRRDGNRGNRIVIKDWRERKVGSTRWYASTPVRPHLISTLTLGLHWCTEDYTATAAKAIATPFRLEECVKIAESQLNGASPLFPVGSGSSFRVN